MKSSSRSTALPQPRLSSWELRVTVLNSLTANLRTAELNFWLHEDSTLSNLPHHERRVPAQTANRLLSVGTSAEEACRVRSSPRPSRAVCDRPNACGLGRGCPTSGQCRG